MASLYTPTCWLTNWRTLLFSLHVNSSPCVNPSTPPIALLLKHQNVATLTMSVPTEPTMGVVAIEAVTILWLLQCMLIQQQQQITHSLATYKTLPKTYTTLQKVPINSTEIDKSTPWKNTNKLSVIKTAGSTNTEAYTMHACSGSHGMLKLLDITQQHHSLTITNSTHDSKPSYIIYGYSQEGGGGRSFEPPEPPLAKPLPCQALTNFCPEAGWWRMLRSSKSSSRRPERSGR